MGTMHAQFHNALLVKPAFPFTIGVVLFKRQVTIPDKYAFNHEWNLYL